MIIDASAWIEFFNGTERGKVVKEKVSVPSCYTPITSLSELSNWAEREKKDINQIMEIVNKLSTILPLEMDISILAGQINFFRKQANDKWGIMDSFVLATAKIYKQEILTKDHDFKDLPEAKILE